jgi:hypothetical protein
MFSPTRQFCLAIIILANGTRREWIGEIYLLHSGLSLTDDLCGNKVTSASATVYKPLGKTDLFSKSHSTDKQSCEAFDVVCPQLFEAGEKELYQLALVWFEIETALLLELLLAGRNLWI